MKKLVIFLLVFCIIFGAGVYAYEFSLQASSRNNEITLTWNNFFLSDEYSKQTTGEYEGEGEIQDGMDEGLNQNHAPTIELISPVNNIQGVSLNPTFVWRGFDEDDDILIYDFHISDGIYGSGAGNLSETQYQQPQISLEYDKEYSWYVTVSDGSEEVRSLEFVFKTLGEENDGTVGGDNANHNVITTEAIISGGFFSNVLKKVIDTLKSIFGLNPVATLVGDERYLIYRHIRDPNHASGFAGEIIKEESLSYFNCEEICSYAYTENSEGTYRYSIAPRSNNEILENSEMSNEIEIINEPEPECSNEIPCEDGKVCNNGICTDATQPECESNEDCDDGKVCNIEEGICGELICNAGNLNINKSEKCLLDVGICQKTGQKISKCIQDSGNFLWNITYECSVLDEERCEQGEDCESGICSIDINSCLPVDFENEETNCNDNLDSDCDGTTDCNDSDCISSELCIENEDDYNYNNQTNRTGEEQINNIPPRSFLDDIASRAGSDNGGNSKNRDVTGRIQGKEPVGSQYPKESSSSIATWLVVFSILLVFGVAVIYLYLFKFKRYNKKDIIAWVEFSRNIINEGHNLEYVEKKLKLSNLPNDFIKIIIKKL